MGGILLLVLVLLGILAHESEKPEFCITCHIMQPYYDSWKSSSHHEVNCLQCHFKPGVQGFIRGKVVAFSQFVRYITVTYGSKPWAAIPDESCTQSGCHAGATLKGPIEYELGISFDHSHHLQGLRRGKKLRCTSCHSQIVQGSHMIVTPEVCYICHFKPEADGTRNAKLTNCRTCHAKGVSSPLTPSDHAMFMERGADCLKCHINPIRGDGPVPRRRCESCHAEPGHLKVEDPEILHRDHLVRAKVECFECHEPIKHGVESMDEIANADCGICHAERHQIQKAFYRGDADVPLGVKRSAAMIEAHIACSGCHSEMEEGDRPTSPGSPRAVAYASGKACDYCHGPGYDNLLEDWHTESIRRIGQVRGLTRIASAPLASAETSIPQVAAQIQYTLDVIEEARAVHNIGYAASLIDHSQRSLLRAAGQTEIGGVLRGWLREEMVSFQDAPSCLQRCHYGISHKSVLLKNQNRLFPHGPHVNRANLDCGVCHSREKHKVSLPRGYDCNSCHHRQAEGKPCVECHQDVVDFAKGGFAGYNIASEQNLDCASCHDGGADKIVMLNRSACRACHLKDEEYLSRLETELEELGRLGAEVNRGFQQTWNTLDFEGLRIAERVRTMERINGIHNYPLAKKIVSDAEAFLAKESVPEVVSGSAKAEDPKSRVRGP